MTRHAREIIGRCAIGLLGLAFLYGGWACLRTGWSIEGDDSPGGGGRRNLREAPSTLAYGAGAVLIVLGGTFAVAAVVPTRTFERLIGPPDNVTLGDNDWRRRR